jgi:3-hydroxybutyryl-CoA dehydrogenase
LQLAEIEKVSIIGSGTMGHGIGLVYAMNGYQVTLNDLSTEILHTAISHIRDELKTLAENELIPQDEIEAVLSRISTTTDLREAVCDTDFVTEAVWEDLEVKREVFRDLDRLCPDHTILASNTSSLLLRDITARCQKKNRIVITHWVNPAHLVPAVEVAYSEDTADETVELACALLKRLKKVPIKITKEIPGFVINRLQTAMMREVWSLWQQGVASAEDIDLLTKASLGFRWATIGPLETADLGGLDIFYNVNNRLLQEISDAHEPPEELKEMVESGELGLKSGSGFFKYEVNYFEGGQAESVKARDKKHIQLLKLWYS